MKRHWNMTILVCMAGIIYFYVPPQLGVTLLIIGIILFLVGARQKRSLKNEMRNKSLKNSQEKTSD